MSFTHPQSVNYFFVNHKRLSYFWFLDVHWLPTFVLIMNTIRFVGPVYEYSALVSENGVSATTYSSSKTVCGSVGVSRGTDAVNTTPSRVSPLPRRWLLLVSLLWRDRSTNSGHPTSKSSHVEPTPGVTVTVSVTVTGPTPGSSLPVHTYVTSRGRILLPYIVVVSNSLFVRLPRP